MPEKISPLTHPRARAFSRSYVPYNTRKVNQDWMLLKEDEASGTLVFGTFDGHGEHGHIISEVRQGW